MPARPRRQRHPRPDRRRRTPPPRHALAPTGWGNAANPTDSKGSRPVLLVRQGLMKAGSVDELLDVTIECPALDQLQVEVGRILEDRVQPGLTGDDREQRHLHAV